MSVSFDDSISNNVEVLQMLLSDAPPNMRGEAKRAAAAIEKLVTGLQRDNQGNPGCALGTAFAVFMIAQRMVETSTESGSTSNSLIQLLS